jgi:3,4-dihydroxy 2-butanone 4-phosphate synthase/GTP cyclohydrolase II
MDKVKARVEEAIRAVAQGKCIILSDDEQRENEGDLVCAAECVTPETINFMVTHARGLVCVAMDESLLSRFNLPMMAQRNTSRYHTAFTVSVEAAEGVSTGISAADRAHTIQTLIAAQSGPQDILTPGHTFPLKAMPGGVLERRGQTEGSVDLARLAGLKPAGVICEIMNDDGSMARQDDLLRFSKQHQCPMVSVEDLVMYRSMRECLVTEVSSARLPMGELGDFTIKVFQDKIDGSEHVALIKGDLSKQEPILTRMHSECLTGDVFASQRCDCGDQRQLALQKIAEEGGVFIYLRQEGRGIGLANKIRAYALQDEGMDTIEANHKLGFKADHRQYRVGAHILKSLGCMNIRLLTNNPKKLEELRCYGLGDVVRESLQVHSNHENGQYLRTKRDKLGHLLTTLEA